MTPISNFPHLRIRRADGRAVQDPNLHLPSPLAITLRPDLAGYRDQELPLTDSFTESQSEIQSMARTGAPANVLPLATFKQMLLPIIDIDEESAARVGACHTPILGGALLRIEHPSEPLLHKTSAQLFMVSKTASQTHLGTAACGELGVRANEKFPGFALREVCRNDHFQFVCI